MNLGDSVAARLTVLTPVYNSGAKLEKTLSYISSQTLKEFRWIISDNNSTDETPKVINEFATSDPRIISIRPTCRLSPDQHFLFLLDQVQTEYFIFCCDDDLRDANAFNSLIECLDVRPQAIACSTVDRLEGNNCMRDFEICGSLSERLAIFLQNAWSSHGIFYSMVRTSPGLEAFRMMEYECWAVDWIVNLRLLEMGEILRCPDAITIYGGAGISNSEERTAWSYYRKSIMDWALPGRQFAWECLKLIERHSNNIWLSKKDCSNVGRLLVIVGQTITTLWRSEYRFLLRK